MSHNNLILIVVTGNGRTYIPDVLSHLKDLPSKGIVTYFYKTDQEESLLDQIKKGFEYVLLEKNTLAADHLKFHFKKANLTTQFFNIIGSALSPTIYKDKTVTPLVSFIEETIVSK